MCQTQWNYAPSGLPTGLRYGDALAILQARRDDLGADVDLGVVLADLQVAEKAFVKAKVDVLNSERPQNDDHR